MNEKWIDYVIKDFNIITNSGLDIEMKDLIESIDTVEKFDINHKNKNC